MVHFVSSIRRFFCVNFDKRNIFEIFHTFILNCSKITTNVSIFQRPFLKFRQWGESIQIKKVHSVYITLWTLHLRKEGDSNPRYRYQYDSLANCWFQPLTHLSSGSLLRVQRYIRYFSLPNFLGCFFAVIFHNICKSLSVSGGCGTLWLRSFAKRQILSMFAYASRQSRPNQVWMLCARFALSYGEK